MDDDGIDGDGGSSSIIIHLGAFKGVDVILVSLLIMRRPVYLEKLRPYDDDNDDDDDDDNDDDDDDDVMVIMVMMMVVIMVRW